MGTGDIRTTPLGKIHLCTHTHALHSCPHAGAFSCGICALLLSPSNTHAIVIIGGGDNQIFYLYNCTC